ncbi:acyl-CoA dehydrogenase family protein [Streptomyces sp. P9(2023)]|uniref:acyl-CoA dehydrogenase family protein n=1 Tax=Streptomyces sp. P9(2023) TaxID=3064394 RepID=UPI0028F401FC|nr:acyl-CoA dehydrogenase family protein [Streptomyces sp. P9(2023)]MDT9690532.1 acyl-CoA dehydrogenase family protein [Streptomyces sp. P9(2023)]
MDFRLTDDQKALKAGVRELLEGRFGREALRAAVDSQVLDRGLWRDLGAAGFFALRLPEEAGGVGLGLPEAVLVFEEAGRVLLPGPLIATHLAAGSVDGAAEGEVVVTAVDGGLVEWLEAADVVLGDVTGAVAVRSVDPLTPLHRVPGPVVAGRSERNAPAGAPSRVPTRPALRDDCPHGAVLLTAAEQLGSASRTTEMAVAYARNREQFGQAVGAFQAVKHLCAEMLVRTEVARAAVYGAAVTADPVEIAGAKLLADEAAVQCARDCLQVHGGMGFTWEADVHLHLKRAWVRAERGLTRARAEEMEAAAL